MAVPNLSDCDNYTCHERRNASAYMSCRIATFIKQQTITKSHSPETPFKSPEHSHKAQCIADMYKHISKAGFAQHHPANENDNV